MESEVYFLRYAFPCSHVLCNIRNEITKEEYRKMEKAAREGEILDKTYLEKVFFRAFDRINKIASEMKKDKWDVVVIEEYFRARHTDVVNQSTEYPETFKDKCRVHEAIIKRKDGDRGIVEYEWDGKKMQRKVFLTYVPDAKLGDKVTIHYSYAVEKIESKSI